MAPVSVRRSPTPAPSNCELDEQFGADTASEATAMTKSLLYMAPIALIGLVATEASATPAAWSGSMGRNITATVPEGTGVPPVLVCQRGGRGGGGARAGGGGARAGGGGARAGGGGARAGGGGSWAGAGRGNFSGANANRGNFSGANVNRGNFNSANVNRGNYGNVNVNRNVNVSGGGYGGAYYGGGWGGVAAGVAAGAIVGGAVASTAYPAPAYPYPYPSHTQITRIADFERLQHDGTLSLRDSVSARKMDGGF